MKKIWNWIKLHYNKNYVYIFIIIMLLITNIILIARSPKIFHNEYNNSAIDSVKGSNTEINSRIEELDSIKANVHEKINFNTDSDNIELFWWLLRGL